LFKRPVTVTPGSQQLILVIDGTVIHTPCQTTHSIKRTCNSCHWIIPRKLWYCPSMFCCHLNKYLTQACSIITRVYQKMVCSEWQCNPEYIFVDLVKTTNSFLTAYIKR